MLNSLNCTFIAEARSNFHDLVLPPASAPRFFLDITGQPTTPPTSLAPTDYSDKGCPVMSVNVEAPAQSPKAVEPILAFSISAPCQIYSVILGLHCPADQFTSTIGEVL